jgi:hypothetical protein
MTITRIDTSTKADSAATEKVVTHVAINWDGMTEADLIALAQQTIVIKLQAAWRRAATIPHEANINATDYKVGTRAAKAPVDPVELAKKMTPEQLAALIEKLQAMNG